jgi:hypothetical protein
MISRAMRDLLDLTHGLHRLNLDLDRLIARLRETGVRRCRRIADHCA